MALIEIKDLHLHVTVETLSALLKIDQILTNTNTIMSSLAQITTEFNSLKTAIAEERAQATAKLAELQASIDALQQNITEGGTTEERDALLADITTQIAEVKAIIPDPAQPNPEA